MPLPKPPYDSELEPILAAFPPGDITADAIPGLRQVQNDAATLEITLKDEPFTHEERTIQGPGGPIILSIFRPKDDGHPSDKPRPGIYQMHSGGMICGNRFTFVKDPLRWAKATGAIVVTVEYRQAPEHPFPAPVVDCWAGLKWVGENLGALGIDPDRLLVTGQSAGANLAAAMAILARDNKGPKLCGQLLDTGMLDDRMDTVSMNQFVSDGTWTRGSSVTAWTAYLGDKRGKDDVSHLAAVMRLKDASNLPPAFLSCGSSEGFRDENLDYAKKLWAAGTQAELHVWPGGYHCFDLIYGDAVVSKQSLDTRTAWVKKRFAAPAAKL